MAVIEVNDVEILAALNRLLQTVENPRPGLLDIAETLLTSTRNRFDTKKAPDGSQWDRNSDVTIALKGENNPLIGGEISSDELSVVGGSTLRQQLDYDIFADGIELYSTMEYAAMQQFGGTKAEFPHLWGDIPARPFLGLSDDDRSQLLVTLQRHIEATWR